MIVLRNKVEAYDRSLDEVERDKSAADAYMRREMEALMRSMVELFDDVTLTVTEWQADVAANAQPGDPELPRRMTELLDRMHKSAERTAALGQLLERRGMQFNGKASFLTVARELQGIASFDANHVAEGFAQIRRGESCTLAELEDELSRGVVG